MGGKKWLSKGEVAKIYQTLYAEVEIDRHVYKRSSGGKTFCPLERDVRIVVTSTPRFAKVISHKFANGSSIHVQGDLQDNHARKVARSYLQRVADTIGSVVQAKEQSWHYATPKMDHPVATVGIGVDGTCMLLCEQGYREAMTGTLSFQRGSRQMIHDV